MEAILLGLLLAAAQHADPDPLQFAAVLGGSAADEIRGAAIDSAGNVVFVGHTASTDLPVLSALQQDYRGGSTDVFVGKTDPDGVLLWLTYFGGGSSDVVYDLSLGPDDSIYFVGGTASDNFPVAGGPFLTRAGGTDGFLARLSPDGQLLACGFIGGSGFDSLRGNAVDHAGNHYAVGRTQSLSGTFPVLVGPDLTPNGGGSDAVVLKTDPTGKLEYCGYLGGADIDYGRNIEVDPSGHAWVCGWTNSDEASFPVRHGPDVHYAGGAIDAGTGFPQYGDGFVVRLATDGSTVELGSYIGGTGADAVFGIGIGPDGRIHLAGHTSSDQTTFPVHRGPSLSYRGSAQATAFGDAWVGALSADGTKIDYLGYLGGTRHDRAWKLAVGPAGEVLVAGSTGSGEDSFPHLDGGARVQFASGQDGFVSWIDPDRAELVASTVLGGGATDELREVSFGPAGRIVVAGWTESPDYPAVRDLLPSRPGEREGVLLVTRSASRWLEAGNARQVQETRARTLLRVNGQAGLSCDRTVLASPGSSVEISLDAIGLPGDPAPRSHAVLFAWRAPTTPDLHPVHDPIGHGLVGTTVFPFPARAFDRHPNRMTLVDSVGSYPWFGRAFFLGVGPAPWTITANAPDTPLTIQAVVEDPNAAAGWSLSNLVRLAPRATASP